MRRGLVGVVGCALLWATAVRPAFGDPYYGWDPCYGGGECCCPCYPECWVVWGPPLVTTYTAGAKITKVFYEIDPPKDRPPANNSGLREGDVILEADGQQVTTKEQMADILDKSSGKALRLVVLDPATSLPFITVLDLSAPKLKFGMKYDITPVQLSASQYYLSRPQ